MKIIKRKEAKQKGFPRYFSGKRCVHGHISERFTSNGNCVFCAAITEGAKRREKGPKSHTFYALSKIKIRMWPQHTEIIFFIINEMMKNTCPGIDPKIYNQKPNRATSVQSGTYVYQIICRPDQIPIAYDICGAYFSHGCGEGRPSVEDIRKAVWGV